MKALHYVGPTQLQFVDVPTPEVKEGEVLLKIKKVGICGTDLHIYKGGMNVPTPLIMGHEFVGDIAQVGSGVEGFNIGDKVVAEHVIGCGKCEQCLAGRKNICVSPTIVGLDRPGALAEYMAIPANLVYKLPEGMTYDEAVLVEPLSISVYGVERSMVQAGQTAAVVGQGPIGIFLDAVLKSKGAKVIGADILDFRLDFVKQNGFADEVVNSKTLTAQQILDAHIPGGADIVFEAVGMEPTTQLAIDLVKRGGKIMIVGVYEHNISINLMKIVRGEVTLQGLWTCLNTFKETIELVHSKKIDVSKFITHRYKFDNAIKAFEESVSYQDGRIKSVIEFD